MDRNGTCIGVAARSRMDAKSVDDVNEELRKLEKYGERDPKSKRGCFLTIKHGLQFGGGSKVRLDLQLNNTAQTHRFSHQ